MSQLQTVFLAAALLASGVVLVALGHTEGAACITAALALAVPSDLTGQKAKLGGKK